MLNSNAFCDTVANILGVFDIDWDRDFEDDGYTDLLGLAPLGEPVLGLSGTSSDATVQPVRVIPVPGRKAGSV